MSNKSSYRKGEDFAPEGKFETIELGRLKHFLPIVQQVLSDSRVIIFTAFLLTIVFLSNSIKPIYLNEQTQKYSNETSINWVYRNENLPLLRLPMLRLPSKQKLDDVKSPFKAQSSSLKVETLDDLNIFNKQLNELIGDQQVRFVNNLLVNQNDQIIAIEVNYAVELINSSDLSLSVSLLDNGRLSVQPLQQQQQQQQSMSKSAGKSGSNNVPPSLSDYYFVYPSLMTFLSPLLWGIVVYFYVIKRIAIKQDRYSKKDFFASDKPISSAQQDRLGFSELAQSISKFLRHAFTTAPLTLSINGPWGKGKSSLMRMVFSDLEKVGSRPVWLNAWHHQNEEQFLYGVMTVMRGSVIPDMLTVQGIFFRLKLMQIRFNRLSYWNRFLIAFLFFSSLPITYMLLPFGGQGVIDIYEGDLYLDADGFSLLLQAISPLVSAAIPILSLYSLSKQKLSRFLKQAKGNLIALAKLDLNLDSNAGIRHKFASEFNDICCALGENKLILFIDDLDRCSEERIMEVLETVNFLVSSGDCYVIIGMAEEPVVRAIGNHFHKRFADDVFANVEEFRDNLVSFSKDYLEKIINISIEVPSSTPDEIAELARSQSPDVDEKPKMAVYFPIIGALLIVLMLSLFVANPDFIENVNFDLSSQETTETLLSPYTYSEELQSYNTQLQIIDALDSKSSDVNIRLFVLSILFLLFVFIAIYVVYKRRLQMRELVVLDEPEFQNELRDCMNRLVHFEAKPRTVKQFINRTRFFNLRNEATAKMKFSTLTKLSLGYTLLGTDWLSNDALELKLRKRYGSALENLTEEEKKQILKSVSFAAFDCSAREKEIFMYWVGGIRMKA